MKVDFVSYIKKNKRITLLLMVGIFLVVLGNFFNGDNTSQDTCNSNSATEKINENKLEKILSNVEGAGNVHVFITYENTGVTEYAVDTKLVYDDGETSERKHVISNKEPIINSYTNAQIRGVIATATGAGDVDIKNRLLRCIKAVTGVGYDRISVEMGVK